MLTFLIHQYVTYFITCSFSHDLRLGHWYSLLISSNWPCRLCMLWFSTNAHSGHLRCYRGETQIRWKRIQLKCNSEFSASQWTMMQTRLTASRNNLFQNAWRCWKIEWLGFECEGWLCPPSYENLEHRNSHKKIWQFRRKSTCDVK